MASRIFVSKINWRQIVVHLVAFWFFIHAFQTFSYLYNTKIVELSRRLDGYDRIEALRDNGLFGDEFVYFQLWVVVSGLIGLLVALVLSVMISIKRKWFWVNSLIAFVLAFILLRNDLLGWTYLKEIFWFLGQQFGNMTIEFLYNGIILLIIGLLFLLSGRVNQFIDKSKLSTV